MTINDEIRTAHAREVSEAEVNAATWTKAALNGFSPTPVNDDAPELNVALRVTYTGPDGNADLSETGDLATLLPLDDDVIPYAEAVSRYADVFSVALYEMNADGSHRPYPSIAYAAGQRII